MLSVDKETKLIELFITLDDFCQALDTWKQKQAEYFTQPNRSPQLSDSELLTIMVFYQYSGYKCFAYYYQDYVQVYLKSYFPNLVTYPRFVALIPRILPGLYVFLQWQCRQNAQTGIYYIDSKKLPVCHPKRVHAHRVFKDGAAWGKSSTGWYFGYKLHLLINHQGQILRFLFTPANVADNNTTVLQDMLGGLKGKCFGDRGYLTKLFETFYSQGLSLITKVKKNMKKLPLALDDALKLRKRAVIESINDILMTVFDLEHTRHRSPVNALAHMISALIAYGFYEQKPAVFVPKKGQIRIA